jgi:hypothetical protein
VVDARSIFRSVVVGGGVYTDIRHCNPHVRGGVVSEHAARIVVQFMAACCGKSARQDEISEEQVSGLKDLPDNAVPLARIHRLLDDLSQREKPAGGVSKQATVASEDPADGGEEDEAEAVQKKALHRSSQMQTALKVTADLGPQLKAVAADCVENGHARLGSPAQASE